MTKTLDPYFVARARAAYQQAGGDPDNAVALAWWAQAAKAAGDKKVGAIVTADGHVVATTRHSDGQPGAWYVDDTQRELGRELVRLEREHGPVIHVAYSEVCQGGSRADDLIDAGEAARIAGVKPSTWRAYVSRGDAGVPEPRATFGQSPVWDRADVIAWHVSRPGSGNRTPRR